MGLASSGSKELMSAMFWFGEVATRVRDVSPLPPTVNVSYISHRCAFAANAAATARMQRNKVLFIILSDFLRMKVQRYKYFGNGKLNCGMVTTTASKVHYDFDIDNDFGY